MFSSPARPFYQSASTMSLKAISSEAYERFISLHFQQAGKRIEPEAIREAMLITVYQTFFSGDDDFLERIIHPQ